MFLILFFVIFSVKRESLLDPLEAFLKEAYRISPAKRHMPEPSDVCVA
jgi:hypothetical protein